MKAAWEKVKQQIKFQLPKNTYSLWIDPITYIESEDLRVSLGCPNKFSCNWVMENYYDIIHDNLRKEYNSDIEILLKVEPLKKKKNGPFYSPGSEQPDQLRLPNIPVKKRYGSLYLNKDFVFDRFIVGSSNEFAYSASKSISLGGSWNYHSLLMLAKTGLGKSHLSHAVGNAIIKQKPQTRILYLTAEDFTNEMIFSLKNKRIEEFKTKYRKSCDVLLLEEIHFLSGKEKTQIELGYTLDALTNSNKKIIYTSSLPPKDIPRMSKSLSSRFTSGLVTTISSPDFETRVKIIQQKAREQNLKLSKEIIHFLAKNLKKDIRQIESALQFLKAKTEFLHARIDIALAKDVINCLVSREASITSENIKELVTKYYKIEPDMLRSRSRKKIYTYPRNIYIYLCRNHTNETLQKIAQSINRSHSTVLYATELIENKIKTDKKMRHQVTFLNQKIEDMKS